MKLNPYPEYKDSGVVWLAKVPTHWYVVPNRSTFIEVNDQNHPDEEMLSVTISRGVIKQSTLLDDSSTKDGSRIDRSSYKLVKPGDIAYNKMRAWQGAIGVSTYRGIISPAYVVQRPQEGNNPDFLHYLLRTPAFAKEAERNSYGITSDMWSLRPEHFKTIFSCLPPPEEQNAIVRFLDHTGELINRYISAKERLIALLQEQRQAVIHQAVTHGLDLNVQLKPSDIPWIGDVPAHWEISRTKNEFQSLNHRRVPLSSTERGSMTLRRYDYYGASGVIDKVDSYLFDDELLLIAEDGANLVLRNSPLAIIARGQFWVNNHAHILKPRRGNLDFLAAVMQGINYTPWISGAAQPKLTSDRLMGISIAVPSRSEQDDIMDRTKKLTSPITSSIKRTQHQLTLMEEYRTRLIADVVTGQIDVRGAAVELPTQHL